ncbi:MAG TPA: hypothetical protein VFP87_02825 [Chitinophagaceae bacterium]|nr:hypothetical protein [Chitinophagaceae bacterium]
MSPPEISFQFGFGKVPAALCLGTMTAITKRKKIRENNVPFDIPGEVLLTMITSFIVPDHDP